MLTCGIVCVGLGCGVGTLIIGVVGKSLGARSGKANTTLESARALGIKPTIEEASVHAPAASKPNEILRAAAGRLQWSFGRQQNQLMTQCREALTSSGPPGSDFALDDPEKLEFVSREIHRLRAFDARAFSPTKSTKLGYEYERIPDRALVTVGATLAAYQARIGNFATAETQLEEISHLNALFNDGGTVNSLLNRASDDITTLRAVERVVQCAPSRDDALRVCNAALARLDDVRNIKRQLRAQAACDALVIDAESNRVFRNMPVGFSVRDAFRESVMALWVKHFPHLPEKLEDAKQVGDVLEAMRNDAKTDFMLKNAGLDITWAKTTLQLLMARVRLLEAEIQVLSGQPVTALDPFSGKPIKSARRGGALLLYSYGPDLEDNHGKPQDIRHWRMRGYDLLLYLPPFASKG